MVKKIAIKFLFKKQDTIEFQDLFNKKGIHLNFE